jgi:DNA polymerase-1
MERHGVLLDVDLLRELSREFGSKMIDVETRAHAEAGQPFNLNSPRQIQEILFEKRGLPVLKKTPGGTPSTDEDVLEQLALDHPLPKLILEYRGPLQAQVHLYRQAAGHDQSGHRDGCIPRTDRQWR